MRLGLLTIAMLAVPAIAQDMPGMTMPPAPAVAPVPAAAPAHDHAAMSGMDIHGDMAGMDMGGGEHMHAMKGAYGPYSGTREASGTSWQPDSSTHAGLHLSSGSWALMLHGTLVGAYTYQSGQRGDDKAFLAGHIMGMASRDVSDRDHIQFRLAVSPDPLMGPQGYPLLLASGETADGKTQLIDRQHPHDLFSEVSVSLSHRLSDTASVFVYAGLPGEPAFGPPAYLHRQSIMDDPEAPISHHWLDSTHVSEGVVTVGVVVGAVKVEASRFRGREPDQHRYDIETPNLDSTAVRVGWNPLPELSLQGSFAHQVSPEQLSPHEDLERWSASAIYTRKVGDAGFWATTAAWGRRVVLDGGRRDAPLDAFILESTVHPNRRWTFFARAERIDNNELLPNPGLQQGPTFTVGKVSGGAIRDFRVAPHLTFGVGGLVSRSFTPGGLDPAYGGDRTSGMGFVRLKLD
jgi:hypothetical protein